MKRLSVFVAGILLTSSLLAACSGAKTEPSGDPSAPQGQQAEYLDTIRFSSSADAASLDPHDVADNTSDNVTMMIYDRLVKRDEKMNIVPDLAEKWSVSEDGLTWTFQLRSGVKFHDGTPFDSTAVKKSFERLADPQLNLKRRTLFAVVEKIDTPDPLTVKFTTKEPFAPFLATAAHPATAIVSPAAAEKYGKDLARNPVGTGAYKFVEWQRDEQITLVRNDEYWGPKAKTKNLLFKPIKDASARVMALQTGETDAISHVAPTDLNRLKSDKGFSALSITSNSQRFFRFNHAKPIWSDPRVRQAVSHAIDRKAILDNVMGGIGSLSVGPISPVVWGAPDLGAIPYDPEKAKRLLAEAGYPDGFSMTITTTARYDMGVEMAEAIQAQLAKVGIKSKLEVLEWGVFTANINGKKPDEMTWDFFIMGGAPPTADADWGLRPVYTTQPTNANNYGFYSNKQYDELIFQAMRETDETKRKELYRQASEIVYREDPTAVWLFDSPWTVVTTAKLKDVTMLGTGHVTFEKATAVK